VWGFNSRIVRHHSSTLDSKNGQDCSSRKFKTMDLRVVLLKRDLFRRPTRNDDNSGNSGSLVRPRVHDMTMLSSGF